MPELGRIYSTSWSRGPSAGWLTVPLDLFSAFVLSAMVLLTCADVIGREVFNSPVFAAVEITTLMMPLLVFAVLPYVTYNEQHISVDLIDLVYPKSLINIRQIGLTILLIPLLAGVTWQMIELALDWEENLDLTEDLRFPKWYIAWFIAILTGLTALLLILNLPRYLTNLGPQSPREAADDADPADRHDGL